MVYVNFLGFASVTVGVGFIAKPGITQGKHVKAVYAVSLIKTAVPNLQIGERHCKVIHNYFLMQVLLAIVYKSVKIGACLLLVAECAECKTSIVDFIGFCIIVIHCCDRFGRAQRCLREAVTCTVFIALGLVANSK